MKSGNTSKITAIAVACLSLGMYAMAQKGAGPGGPHSGTMNQPSSMQQNQSMQSQQNTATTSPTPKVTGTAQAQQHVKTSPTPPGHHYGWEKGKHNPHRSPTTSPSASATATPSATVSATASATPSATATATATSTATATATGTP